MELDPHYCCQPGGDSRYCGDQHGSGVGSGYYALRQGEWKLLVGDPAGGTQHEINKSRCRVCVHCAQKISKAGTRAGLGDGTCGCHSRTFAGDLRKRVTSWR